MLVSSQQEALCPLATTYATAIPLLFKDNESKKLQTLALLSNPASNWIRNKGIAFVKYNHQRCLQVYMGKTDASQVCALSNYALRPTVWRSIGHTEYVIHYHTGLRDRLRTS